VKYPPHSAADPIHPNRSAAELGHWVQDRSAHPTDQHAKTTMADSVKVFAGLTEESTFDKGQDALRLLIRQFGLCLDMTGKKAKQKKGVGPKQSRPRHNAIGCDWPSTISNFRIRERSVGERNSRVGGVSRANATEVLMRLQQVTKRCGHSQQKSPELSALPCGFTGQNSTRVSLGHFVKCCERRTSIAIVL